MKLILLGILYFTCFVQTNAQFGQNGVVYEGLEDLTKQLTIGFLEGFNELIEDYDVRFPVLPIFINLTDPMELEDGAFSFDSHLLRGSLSSVGSVVTGLSSVVDDLNLISILPPFEGSYRLNLSTVALSGNYEADLGLINNITQFLGKGEYSIELKDAFLQVDFKIRLMNLIKVNVTLFDVQLGFQSLDIQAEAATFNGVVANWAEINPEIKRIFDGYWPVLHTKLVAPLRHIINDLLKNCVISELLPGPGQDLSCIGEPNPTIQTVPTTADANPEITSTVDPANPEITSTEDGNVGPTTTDPSSSTSSSSIVSISVSLLIFAVSKLLLETSH